MLHIYITLSLSHRMHSLGDTSVAYLFNNQATFGLLSSDADSDKPRAFHFQMTAVSDICAMFLELLSSHAVI